MVNLFSTPIGRLAFLARYFLAAFVIGVGAALLGFADSPHAGSLVVLLLGGIIEIFGLIYLIRFTIFARLTSIGLSRWWILLLLVPLVNCVFFLYLLFCPGGRFVRSVGGDEETDSDPLDSGFICLFAAILFTVLVQLAIKPLLESLSAQAALFGYRVVLVGYLSLIAAAVIIWFPGPRCAWPPRRWPLVLVLLCSVFQILGTFLSMGRGTPPAKAITGVFRQYREGALANDADAVWSVLDSRTRDFYSEVVNDARALPPSGLARLDYTHKLMVLLLRMEMTKQELEGFEGQAAFLLARRKGWIHAQGADDAKSFAKISVIGPHALAYRGFPNSLAARFVLEGTEWKLDFGDDFSSVNDQLAKAKAQSRLSEREFFKAMLRRYSNSTFDDRIFQDPID
jgi:hypothetical protein